MDRQRKRYLILGTIGLIVGLILVWGVGSSLRSAKPGVALLMVAVFVGPIAAVVGLGLIHRRSWVRKWVQRHGELVGIVDGTFKTNEYLSSPRLVGAYNGVPVEYTVLARQDLANEYNRTVRVLTMTSGGGGKDWEVYYGSETTAAALTNLLGEGSGSWHIHTEDELLERRLLDSGVIEIMDRSRLENLPADSSLPFVHYKAREGSLSYVAEIPDTSFVASPLNPDQFKAWLDVLTTLSEINKRVNVG